MWPFRRGGGKAASGVTLRLSSIATALPALTDKLELQPRGRAGLCFRPSSPNKRNKLQALTQDTVAVLAGDALSSDLGSPAVPFKVEKDSFGYLWVVFRDASYEALASAVIKVADAAVRQGYGDRLAVTLFPFKRGQQDVFWIFNFASGRFYPFVPTNDTQRDNELELSMARTVPKELPIDPALERWRGLWGAPV
ncbi:MAG: hypothetical protein FJ315_07505 [SAR202 cluster bacterium]|nr:hypothetical protein [SAR202 cluster bacterium]